MFSVCLCGNSFSADNGNINLNRYKSTGDTGSIGTTITDPVKEFSKMAVAIVRIVGAGVAICMIIAVAIKYMSAAPGERADFKKSSLQFIIGALIVFGSSNILATIVDFANEKIGNT